MTAEEIREARKRLGLSQHAMADALGMGRWGWQSVAKWESGKQIAPRFERRILDLLEKVNG